MQPVEYAAVPHDHHARAGVSRGERFQAREVAFEALPHALARGQRMVDAPGLVGRIGLRMRSPRFVPRQPLEDAVVPLPQPRVGDDLMPRAQGDDLRRAARPAEVAAHQRVEGLALLAAPRRFRPARCPAH